MNTTAEAILFKYEENISLTGLLLRNFLLSELPDIIEQPDPSANIIGYGYGKGYKETICTIIPSKKGIKLGLYKGAELPDPEKLLTGSGKIHKYVEIKSSEEIETPHLKQLLKEAIIACKKRIL